MWEDGFEEYIEVLVGDLADGDRLGVPMNRYIHMISAVGTIIHSAVVMAFSKVFFSVLLVMPIRRKQ